MTLITKNKKAFFDYEIIEKYEAWIELFWYEVKSIRNWHINLKWWYISMLNWRPILKQVHVTPWQTIWNKAWIETDRDRKIFLHKKTIFKLIDKQKENWYAIIPLDIYLKWSLVKVTVWLCKWKKEYDKKHILKEKSIARDTMIELKKYV